MALDLTSLQNAVARLEEGLARHRAEPGDTQLRDGLVQRFEFTYELSHKTIKRYLEQSAATPSQYDTMAFADLIRSANEAGLLLGDWPKWKRYRELRGRSSHTYREDVAAEVVAVIPEFLAEAAHLRDELERRAT